MTQSLLNNSPFPAVLEHRIDSLLTRLEAIEFESGPISDEDRLAAQRGFRSFSVAIGEWLEECGQLSPEAREGAIAQLQERFLSTFLRADGPRRFYEKPRGYAGDSESIEMIYDNVPGGDDPVGELLDECFLAQPAAAAVRNRRELLANQIRRVVENCQGETAQIASLACGPARELFDVVADPAVSNHLHATCVDLDEEALATVAKTRAENAPAASIDLVRENLISVAFGRRKLPVEPLDLAYSIGLIDYFEDRVVVKLLDAIHDHLKPGGTVILGNFHPDNPDRGIMECFLEWNLIHRSEDDMRSLFAASKFGAKQLEIVFEDERVNLFAIAHKAA